MLLTIKKEEANDKLSEFLKELGYVKDLQNKIIMTAKDGDIYLGAGALELIGSKVYLNFVDTKDDELSLRLGIAKSLLNLADLRGIKFVYGNNEDLEKIYKLTRFKKENDEYILNLEGYFDCGC